MLIKLLNNYLRKKMTNMKILRNREYNPKLDYLICKSLLSNLPGAYDETVLRNCYKEKQRPLKDFEKDIIRIKDFFASNDVQTMSTEDWIKLLKLTVKYDVSISNNLFEKLDLEDFSQIIELIKRLDLMYDDQTKIQIFKVLLFRAYVKRYDELLIPYYNNISKMINALKMNDTVFAKKMFSKLLTRTDKYRFQHDIQLNTKVREELLNHKADFLEKFNAERLGIYGSFATKEDNEYSDIDIIVFVSSVEYEMKKQMLAYWLPILNISVDLLVVSDDTFESRTAVAIRNSMIIL